MQYKITNIPPFKAAITVVVINFLLVSLYLVFLAINEVSTSTVIPFEAKNEPKLGIDFYVSILLTRNIGIFIEVVVGCMIFNKLSHYWGGLEVTLDKQHSNQQLHTDG